MSVHFIIDRRGYDTPDLIGPFDSNAEAEAYAAEFHPDDEDGAVWVLQAARPLEKEEQVDEVPPTVFQPEDAEGEYAVVIDHSIDAVYIRDVLLRAAEEHRRKAAKASQGHARDKNLARHETLRKYADRFERVRLMEAERITAALGLRSSQR